MNTATTAPSSPAPAPQRTHGTYLRALTWLFTVFNSVRVLAYLPTLVGHLRQRRQQPAFPVDLADLGGANATMAAWLYEQNGRRVHRAVVVNACNTRMCLATCALIVAYRLRPTGRGRHRAALC